jgi:tRNA/rRNA methyltransferase
MLNFGLTQLRVVDPIADLASDEAINRAAGAAPVLRNAATFPTIPEAAADLSLVLATTARSRDCLLPVYSPREAVGLAADAIARGERVGFLFGSEKNGLSSAELQAAHAIVTIPTAAGFSSLNLAQAVLLLGYEWAAAEARASPGEAGRTAAEDASMAGEESGDDAAAGAPLAMLDSLFSWWERTLWDVGFFGGNRGVRSLAGPIKGVEQERRRSAAAMEKLRGLLMRARPTRGEATLLRGALQTMRTPKAPSE